MSDSGESALRRAERVYSAASDHFTCPALAFWDLYGEETVRRAGITAGDRVLDLCCGAGASVVPAARAVGPSGRVIGVDIAGPLLAIAGDRLAREGLDQAELVRSDATATAFPDASFDAVQCVFGVFFVPDMPAFVREMWRMVRAGGRLAVTTWGPDLWEPATGIFWESVRLLRPELYRSFNPWDEVTSPAALGALLRQGGVEGADVVPVSGRQPLGHPEDFWDIVLGSGYRATVDAFPRPEQDALRAAVLDGLRRQHVAEVTTDAVIATATKPSS
jgi:SAM-dependent methyltransferase